MKNVLLLAHDDQGQEARLQAALDMTRAIDGHLTCLDVISFPQAYADPMSGVTSAIMIEDERLREEANCEALRARLDNEDVTWDLRQVTGDFTPAIKDAAEGADVIVLNSRIEGSAIHDPQKVVGDLVVGTDRPVLAVPEGCLGIDFTGKVLIAWDGSHEASNSVRAALPLLRLAEEAVLFEVGGGSTTHPASEAGQHLSRHGARCRIVSRAAEGPVAGAIQQAARELGASYVVMGAYGHSRIRESLLGGVTRSMLETSDLPLFLAN